jgi:hypothetical protein
MLNAKKKHNKAQSPSLPAGEQTVIFYDWFRESSTASATNLYLVILTVARKGYTIVWSVDARALYQR